MFGERLVEFPRRVCFRWVPVHRLARPCEHIASPEENNVSNHPRANAWSAVGKATVKLVYVLSFLGPALRERLLARLRHHQISPARIIIMLPNYRTEYYYFYYYYVKVAPKSQ